MNAWSFADLYFMSKKGNVPATDEEPEAIILAGLPEENAGRSSSAEFTGPANVRPKALAEGSAAGTSGSRVFELLATPALPPLPPQNRARLLMQGPNKLFFYWSASVDPYERFAHLFGLDAGYPALILRLVDLDRGIVEMHQVGASGSWWFEADANSRYQAEIGLAAPDRPFVRVMFSNIVETPRKTPSPRSSVESQWAVSSSKFARVLEASGFSRDAFDVALTGDDPDGAAANTRSAIAHTVGQSTITEIASVADEEIRFALFALAAGVPLVDLRYRISGRLFAFLEARLSDATRTNAVTALERYFGLKRADEMEEDEVTKVFGASLINFPRRFRRLPANAVSSSSHIFKN